ncbi:hypothetical protein GOQ29_10095 [Clostridium sp. D2Q-14]|uniref:hypothetical protein n=1 Tax=Anaeromonas gelatinilytica TaxID=2683194 RepID=UPI00193B095D|nr:hypothetical protein [Anaeromonas gelatinilytica]
MKPNYNELARRFGVSKQTISKYNNGFEKKETRDKKSKLNKYKEKIKEKINLAGATITGVYKYFYSRDNTIESRSSFA